MCVTVGMEIDAEYDSGSDGKLYRQLIFFLLTKHYYLSLYYVFKGVIWCDFKVVLSLWSVTSWLCIDKIPEVTKTKVLNPKRYSLSKLRLCHAPLKRLIQTRPHMFTSRCGNICVRRGFSNRSSVDAAVSGRRCVFLGESKSTLFGLLKVDAFRNH